MFRKSDFEEIKSKYIDHEKFETALYYFENKILEFPDSDWAWHGKGVAQIQLERYYEAINSFDEAIKITCNQSEFFNGKGLALYHLKEFSAAIRVFEIAISINPLSEKANGNLGQAYISLGEFKKALSCLDKAIDINSSSNLSWALKGAVLSSLKRFPEAQVAFDRAIIISPEDDESWFNKGVIFQEIGEFVEALKCYGEAIRLNPVNPRYLNNLGMTLNDQLRFKEAIPIFQRAVTLMTWEPLYWVNLGFTYYSLGNLEEAKKNIEKGTELSPDDGRSWYLLGLIYDRLEKFDRSIQAFEKFYKFSDPNDIFFQLADRDIQLLNAKKEEPKLEKALRLIDEIAELLIFSGGDITHFTSVSVCNLLLGLNGDERPSPLRASEATFTNDPSEGKALYDYIFKGDESLGLEQNELTVSPKPYLTCFVPEGRNDDLTLWRFYGKENGVEAAGCSITLDFGTFREGLEEYLRSFLEEEKQLTPNKQFSSEISSLIYSPLFEFYKVAYLDPIQGRFLIPAEKNSRENDQEENLNEKIGMLKAVTLEILKKGNNKVKNLYQSSLARISYLFKYSEYLYENEIRLLLSEPGYDVLGIQKIDSSNPRVFLELIPIIDSLKMINLGPKVDKKNFWASTYFYHLKKHGKGEMQIKISRLPFQ